jgi:hypothetical protein
VPAGGAVILNERDMKKLANVAATYGSFIEAPGTMNGFPK